MGQPPLLAIHRRNDGAHPIRAGLADGLRGERRLPHHGVSGEQERSLTGDATAISCTGTFTPLPMICVMQIRVRYGVWECASGVRDATGERSVSLAKISGNTPDILQSALARLFWWSGVVSNRLVFMALKYVCDLSVRKIATQP